MQSAPDMIPPEYQSKRSPTQKKKQFTQQSFIEIDTLVPILWTSPKSNAFAVLHILLQVVGLRLKIIQEVSGNSTLCPAGLSCRPLLYLTDAVCKLYFIDASPTSVHKTNKLLRSKSKVIQLEAQTQTKQKQRETDREIET